jgi:membrane-bound metal-dependent hydrolase YbcI (DUF457 family)
MPSPISHIAAGVIIYRSLPAEARQNGYKKFIGIPVLLILILSISLLPDVDAVLGIVTGDMGGYHNQASHSLFTGLIAALFLGLLMRWWIGAKFLATFGLVFAAYAVHLFLDMLTHGRGIMLLWPFTSERFLSPVLLFYGLRWSHGLWSISHLWTFVSEIGFWGIVFGLAHLYQKRRKSLAKMNGAAAFPRPEDD